MTFNVTQTFFSSSDGTLIYAEAVGNKNLPALVFLHGFALSALVWAQILSDARLLQFFYLVAYDMRGHGRSGKPGTVGGHTSALYANDFAAVSRGFQLQSPLFIGWSLGATNAADITANLRPNAISGIVWTSPLPWLSPDTIAAISKPVVISLLPALIQDDNVTLALESRNAFVDSLFNAPASVPTDIKWSWVASGTQQAPTEFGLLSARVQDPTGLFAAGARGVPLLVLTGGADALLRGEPVWDIARAHFTDVTIHNIPNGSHTLFFDSRDEFVETLAKFAKRVFRVRV